MARHSIVEKLQSELHRPVETEMQVVYILVEVRKLLEHNAQKDLYPVLNFYSNWVVHTRLSASPVADRIVRLFDEIMYRKANDAVDTTLEGKAVDFFDERLLRDELRTFLESSDLPTEICTEPVRWHAFRKRLVGVIEDVPLELRPSKAPNPTHFVESVIVKNKSTDDALHVEWQMVMHSHPLVEVKNGKMRLKGKRPVKP
jgi:hypothetical protein